MLKAERILLTSGEKFDEVDIILTEEGIAILQEGEFNLIYHNAIQSIKFTDAVAINFMRARSMSYYLTDVNEVQDTLEEFDYAVKELQEHLHTVQNQVQAGDEAESDESADNGKNPYA